MVSDNYYYGESNLNNSNKNIVEMGNTHNVHTNVVDNKVNVVDSNVD